MRGLKRAVPIWSRGCSAAVGVGFASLLGISAANAVVVDFTGTFTDTRGEMNGTALVGKASQIFAATLRKLAETD